MNTQVKISDRIVSGLKNIQDNYNDIQDLMWKLEDYIISVENNEVPAQDTLNALRSVRKIGKYLLPLEF